MSKYATTSEVQEIVNHAMKTDVQSIVDKAVDDLSAIMRDFMGMTQERFERVDEAVADLKSDVADLAEFQEESRTKFGRLEDILHSFLKRLDNNEANNAVRDVEVVRIKDWVAKASTKLHLRWQE